MPKVSVIIPVYNTGKYLRECVESVLSQSFTDLEIILIDDGSKDDSPRICEELSNKDKRVSVVHKNNEGLSMARNDGLALAKGNYVLFLDSDDFWMSNDCLSALVEFAESHHDNFTYIEFNRSRFFPSDNYFTPCPLFPTELEKGQNAAIVIEQLIIHGIFPMSACTKFLRRDFLESKNISFIKGIFSEDIPWFFDILRKAEAPIYFINSYFYGNRAEVSTSLTSTFSVKKYKDVVDIIVGQIILINEDKWSDAVKESLLSFLAYRYCILLAQYSKYKKQLSGSLIKTTKELKFLLKYSRHPKVKQANRLYRFLGMEITAHFLLYYMDRRDTIKRKQRTKVNCQF